MPITPGSCSCTSPRPAVTIREGARHLPADWIVVTIAGHGPDEIPEWDLRRCCNPDACRSTTCGGAS
jgi:hypothetical protein